MFAGRASMTKREEVMGRLSTTRLVRGLAMCALGLSVVFPGYAASTLGTPAQIKAEKTAMALLNNPQIKTAQEKLREELKTTPLYAMAGAPQALDHALQEWTLALAMRHQAADLSTPQILWQFDDTPHSWF